MLGEKELCSKDTPPVCVPTKLMPKQYGIKLARKLLRKVIFSKGVAMGLWNIQLSIRDGDQTDGDQKIPFTVANCEPPDLVCFFKIRSVFFCVPPSLDPI